jgi:death-on-curing family protein
LRKSSRSAFPLSADFIEYLHDAVVSVVWPQTDPISPGEYRDRRLVESAANRPFQSAFGEDAYPNMIEKAAALFHSLIANHCFHNGNKRTAVLALDAFLAANGLLLRLNDTETYQLARSVASYRELGTSHSQLLEQIVSALTLAIVEFATLKGDAALKHLSPSMERFRRALRRHPLNKVSGRSPSLRMA